MTRAQRAAHAFVWLALGPVLLFGIWLAVVGRPAMPIQARPDVVPCPAKAGDSSSDAGVAR